VVANIYYHYRHLDPDTPKLSAFQVVAMQADWAARRA
jgi:hypothetical protein